MSFERDRKSDKPKRKLLSRTQIGDETESFMSASLSRFALDEFVCVNSSGEVEVRHFERESALRRFSGEARFRCDETDAWQCCFGMHPREVVLADRTGVAMFDARAPANVKSCDLFTLPHPSLHSRERVYLHRPHAKSNLHHLIATTNHLFVVDQRNPSHPLLTWNHLLRSPPTTMRPLYNVNDECGRHDVIFLSCQDNPECHAFEVDLARGDAHPVLIDLPWRVSRPRYTNTIQDLNQCSVLYYRFTVM